MNVELQDYRIHWLDHVDGMEENRIPKKKKRFLYSTRYKKCEVDDDDDDPLA
jgi:hypothetical protein